MFREIDSMRFLNQRFTRAGFQVKIKSDTETIVPSAFFRAIVTWGPMGFRFILKMKSWVGGVCVLVIIGFIFLDLFLSRTFPLLLILGVVICVALVGGAFATRGNFQRIIREVIDEVEKSFLGVPSAQQQQFQPPYTPLAYPSPVQQKYSSSNVCPKCTKQILPEFALCPFCGHQLKSPNVCRKCNRELALEFVLCPYCGTPK